MICNHIFKNLPFFELDWGALEPGRIIRPQLSVHPCKRITEMAVSIIETYQKGEFEKTVIRDDSGNLLEIESRELVIYVNSVKNICDIIRRAGLTYENTNVLCSSSKENQRKIRAAFGLSRGQEGGIGKVPLRGEPRKMFTLCTRTVYLGADFYSTCAWSVIVSDCKIDSLATDIRMDFPQIMGRQRLKENVFRDECIFIYKLADSEITFEEFDRMSKRKLKESEIDLKNYRAILLSEGCEAANKLIRDFRLRISAKKYNEDYTGICEKTGEPTLNKLVMLAEKRAFELRSNIYKNDVLVYNEFEGIS